MKHLALPFLLLTAFSALAQVNANKQSGFYKNELPQKKDFIFQKRSTVNFSAISKDYNPILMMKEMPKQRAERIEKYNYPENHEVNRSSSMILPPLYKGQSYVANPWGLSTPNDNDLAISDSGIIVSVVNTNILIRNTITNSISPIKSLNAFTSPINSNHQEFDPKVMYDPRSDKFVLVCLVGFVDTTSKIIVGFSQTNDPNGNWNLYTLPGNPLNNNLWTDYPMISMTEKELFLSVNLLVNNQPWQTGFVESVVWQMKKEKGYAGLPIGATLHSNINFAGRPIRNLCPVKGGSQLYAPNMYFISNRNLASQNDSVFLVNITDTLGAPTGSLTVKVMVSNQPYYFPADGHQIAITQSLATNDCRNLGAFFENNQIQYVHNTANPTNSLCTVYHGIISAPASASPVVTGYLVQNDTVDFAYPNISYAGNSPSDNTSIISFDHVSNKIYAGVSAIRADGLGDYSPKLRIQNGTVNVNLLQGNLERWGDYTGSQRKYNMPGEVWMSGYRGSPYNGQYPNAHDAWVAQLALTPFVIAGVKTEVKENNSGALVFPNPANENFSVELDLSQPEYLSFELYDQQGKLVQLLLRDWVKVTKNVFSFRTHDLSKGVYILKITGNYNTNITRKVVVN